MPGVWDRGLMAGFITPPAPLAAALAVGYLLVALLLVRHWSAGRSRVPALVALAAVVALALAMTLAGYHPHPGVRPVELTPLADVGSHTATELIGNLALLAPFGAFGRLLWRDRPLLVLGAAAVLSMSVEIFQYAASSGRVASVNDVLLNTLGAAVGWLCSRQGGPSGPP